MAYQTAHNAAPAPHFGGVFGAIAGFFARIGSHMIENSAGARRLERVEALRAKSDAELQELGIERDRIVHHVFKDILYV